MEVNANDSWKIRQKTVTNTTVHIYFKIYIYNTSIHHTYIRGLKFESQVDKKNSCNSIIYCRISRIRLTGKDYKKYISGFSHTETPKGLMGI